jgi:hypothetical protein
VEVLLPARRLARIATRRANRRLAEMISLDAPFLLDADGINADDEISADR